MPNESVLNEFKCPNCEFTSFYHDHHTGEIICKRCGLIIDENNIDFGPDRVAYNHDQIKSRIHNGSPATPMMHDGGISSEMDWSNANISQKNIAKYYKLRKWNKRIKISGSKERNLAFALSQLNGNCSTLLLPKSIRERAAINYKKALENKIIRGRTIDGVVAASIYIACRKSNLPRTIDEISKVCNVPRKELGRTYRFIARELNIKLKPTSPKDYVPRFASRLDLSNQSEIKAINIIEESKKEGLITGKGPSGIAAAALYIASVLIGEKRSQKLVAEVAGVSEVTVRNRYKELSENLNLSVSI